MSAFRASDACCVARLRSSPATSFEIATCIRFAASASNSTCSSTGPGANILILTAAAFSLVIAVDTFTSKAPTRSLRRLDSRPKAAGTSVPAGECSENVSNRWRKSAESRLKLFHSRLLSIISSSTRRYSENATRLCSSHLSPRCRLHLERSNNHVEPTPRDVPLNVPIMAGHWLAIRRQRQHLAPGMLPRKPQLFTHEAKV